MYGNYRTLNTFHCEGIIMTQKRNSQKKCLNCGQTKYRHDKLIERGKNTDHPFNPPGGFRHQPPRK